MAEIAPRCQLEIPEHAVSTAEWRQQSGQAQRRVRAGIERQQQQFQMRRRAILRRRGNAAKNLTMASNEPIAKSHSPGCIPNSCPHLNPTRNEGGTVAG